MNRRLEARGRARALWLAVVLSSSCRGGPPPLADYVGGDACADCHEAEALLWTGSHHDLAMQAANPETVLGDFGGATLVRGGVEWTFVRRDSAFFVRTYGPGGELGEYRIAYTFGVAPLQQYLVAFPGGRLQALGIAWDTRTAAEGGQRWFHLYPEGQAGSESPLHWTGPSQRWNSACAECHSTGLDKGFDPDAGTFETTWSDIDVSCEACHGPGSRHVEAARAGRPDPGIPVSFAGARGSWTLAEGAATASLDGIFPGGALVAACAPCHSRRGRIAKAQPPGSPYLDAFVPSLLREGLYHVDGQILDEVYVYGSFLQSRMYAAGVTCSDCHEPHGLGLRAEGNALCTRCHRADVFDVSGHTLHAPGSEGVRCVACHMPATTYMRIDPRRDHSLRVPRPDLTAELDVTNACDRCHADRGVAAPAPRPPPDPAGDLQGRYARAIHGGRVGDPATLPALVAVATSADQPSIRRATALSLLGGYAPSLAGATVRDGLADPDPLVRLGALDGLPGAFAPLVLGLAGPLLDDSLAAVRAEAARVIVRGGGVPSTVADQVTLRRAGEIYERAQRVNADHSSAWVNLGDLYRLQNRLAEAEGAYRKALELDETDWSAYLNLADLQRSLGLDDLTVATLRQGLATTGDVPELLHAMGLLEVRRGRDGEALDWLARAAAGRPERPRFAYVYGVALWSAGERERGMRVLEGALRRHPFDQDLLAALAAYSRELGDSDGERDYARRLLEVAPDLGSVTGPAGSRR